MSRVFSISLNEITFAKLGELRKLYPDMSRNAMIGHIINVYHSGEVSTSEENQILISELQEQLSHFAKLLKKERTKKR